MIEPQGTWVFPHEQGHDACGISHVHPRENSYGHPLLHAGRPMGPEVRSCGKNKGKTTMVIPLIIPNYHGEKAIVSPIVFQIEEFQEMENYGIDR